MKKILAFLFIVLFATAARAQTINDTAALRTAINTDIVPNAVGGITATKLNRILQGNINALSKVGVTSFYRRADSVFYVKAGTETFAFKDSTGGGGGSGTVNSGAQYRLGYYASLGTSISAAAAITASRALISDANGVPTHSATTATEIGYLSGVNGLLQTQINNKKDTLQTYGYMVDTTLNHSVSGGTGYFNNFTNYGLVSAATSYKLTTEFTLTTKPTATTEGLFLGKLSANSFSRSSVVARAVYVDASNWTINLYAIGGFSTETLVASTPIYTPASIAMTNGANYRIEISFNSPTIQVDFSRIDTTLSYNKSVIERISIPYTYTMVIGSNPQVANTGYYCYGTIGSSPAGVYAIHKMKVEINSYKNIDMVCIGNSVLSGYNTSTPQNTFTNKLFNGTGKTYAVFAGASDRTDELLLRMGEVFATNPKYALIEIGWNDIGNSSGSVLFSANLTRVIDTLQNHVPAIVPIVLKLPPTGFGYDTAFINVCARKNVKLIDPGATLIGSLDAFDIHPNDRGNMIIANLVRLRCPEIFGAPNPLLLDNNSNVLNRTITANASADINTNKYYVDATSGNITLSLYAADVATVGKQVSIVRTDATANTVTLAAAGGNTINGVGSVLLKTQYQELLLSGITSTAWIASTAGPVAANGATTGRWTARVGSTTSSATPTINTDNVDIYKLTALAADITSMTTNLSGTPVDGDILEIQITGTATRAITWGASFVSSSVSLPTTTVTTSTLTVVLQYYTTSSYGNNKWVCVNSY